jgi:hypothetical protein
MSKLYIVVGDNHDYDAMSQWVVGAFTTKRRANNAIKKDDKYMAKYGGLTRKIPRNYEVTEVEINKPREE